MDYSLTHPDWEFWDVMPSVTAPEPFRRVHFDFLQPDQGTYFWRPLDRPLAGSQRRPHFLGHWLVGRHRQVGLAAGFNLPVWVDPRTVLGHTGVVDPWWWRPWAAVQPPRWVRLWEAVCIPQNTVADYLERWPTRAILGHADHIRRQASLGACDERDARGARL